MKQPMRKAALAFAVLAIVAATFALSGCAKLRLPGAPVVSEGYLPGGAHWICDGTSCTLDSIPMATPVRTYGPPLEK